MYVAKDDPQRFLVLDIQFHRAIGQACGNPLLAALVDMVADLFYDERKQTVYRWHGAEAATEQHRVIYEAIRNGDPEQARAAMDEHLRWALRTQEQETEVLHHDDVRRR